MAQLISLMCHIFLFTSFSSSSAHRKLLSVAWKRNACVQNKGQCGNYQTVWNVEVKKGSECVCIAPERLFHTSKVSGKGSQRSDCTLGHKTPTMHCILPLTPLRHGEKAIKAFIGFAPYICSQQLKIITNQIKIKVPQTTIQPGHRLDLCYCERAYNDW